MRVMESVVEPVQSEGIPTSSPRNWRGLGRILLFVLLLVLISFGLHAVISLGLRRITTSKFGAINTWMDGNVNSPIIINGSSRALVQYDPRIIARETGMGAYNLGMNGIQIDVQAGILDAYLSRNKAPVVILQNLEAFSFETTRRGEIYDAGVYVPYLSTSEPLYRALLAIDPDVWKWRHIPLYGYAVPDMRFTWALGILRWFSYEGRQDYFDGFNPRHVQWNQDFESFRHSLSSGVTYRIELEGVAALERCLELAQSHGAAMILVFAPEYYEMQKLEKNRPEVFEQFRELATKYGVEFWDFSDSSLSRDHDYFYNSQHLNARGAELFSEEIARRLRRYLAARKEAPASKSLSAAPTS